jgi:hypothetical protein
VPVESLGPGVRRDDGIRNEFNALIAATMAAQMCESDSAPWGRGKAAAIVASKVD